MRGYKTRLLAKETIVTKVFEMFLVFFDKASCLTGKTKIEKFPWVAFQMLRLSGLAAQQFPRPTGYTSHCADTPEHPCLPCNIGIEVLSDFEGGGVQNRYL